MARDTAGWRFSPPAVTREFQEDFEALLQSFAARGTGPHPVRLLPVLVDYPFCGPGVFPVRTEDPAGRQSQCVLDRLKLAQSQGYPLALAWSFLASDRHACWTPRVEDDIDCFTQGRTCR